MYLGENLGVMIDDNGANPLLGRGGFFRPVARVAAPPPPPVVNLTPSVPVFANIDNSAYWAQQGAQSATPKDAPNSQPLPAGIKAVDYSAPPPVKLDPIKIGLYAVGIIGIIMLLSRKGR